MSLNINYWANSAGGSGGTNASRNVSNNSLYSYILHRNGVNTTITNQFKTTPTISTDVQIGATMFDSMTNLRNKINSTTYPFPKTVSGVQTYSNGRRLELRLPANNPAIGDFFSFNVVVDGVTILTVAKSITSNPSSATNVLRGASVTATLNNVLSSLRTFNSNPNVQYNLGNLVALDADTIYVDVYPELPFTTISFTNVQVISGNNGLFTSNYAVSLYRFNISIYDEAQTCNTLFIDTINRTALPAWFIDSDCIIIEPVPPATFEDVILTKSPYWFTYTNAAQYTFARLQLFVYRGTKTNIPAQPTYSFDKYKVLTTDTSVSFNVSDFVDGLINPKLNDAWFSGSTQITDDFQEAVWVRYTLTGFNGTNELDTIEGIKIALKGWGYFEQGPNPSLDSNVLSDVSDNYLTSGQSAWKAELNLPDVSGTTVQTIVKRTNLSNILEGEGECKFDPYQIVFINKNGVFEGFSFPKASYRTIITERKNYQKLSRTPQSYSTTNHYKANLLNSSYEEIQLNTNLLANNDVEALKQLIESDLHYLVDKENIIHPVILKQEDFRVKSSINDRANIQYQITFEFANNVKNNIR